jgi:hypothetical protein
MQNVRITNLNDEPAELTTNDPAADARGLVVRVAGSIAVVIDTSTLAKETTLNQVKINTTANPGSTQGLATEFTLGILYVSVSTSLSTMNQALINGTQKCMPWFSNLPSAQSGENLAPLLPGIIAGHVMDPRTRGEVTVVVGSGTGTLSLGGQARVLKIITVGSSASVSPPTVDWGPGVLNVPRSQRDVIDLMGSLSAPTIDYTDCDYIRVEYCPT